MATNTTARPARTRAARTTPAKAAPAKAAVEPKATEVETEVEVETIYVQFEQHPDGDTKSYARFVPPKGMGMVGTIYVPLGTKAVTVKISG